MNPEFRNGENPREIKLVCTECGGKAEGNCSWDDGSGEICDACFEADKTFAANVENAHLAERPAISAKRECNGHPAEWNDPMGRTVHCDGSCVSMLHF